MTRQLRVHFLRVGDGDCTIIELPDGKIMMIDIMNGRIDNSHNEDYENPINYLKNLTNSRSIHRYIQTHPDMDHMDGFADLVKEFEIVNFWDTANTKKKPDDFTNNFREEDWDAYKYSNKGRELDFGRRTRTVKFDEGFYIYDIFPLSPTQSLVDSANSGENWNELSYVTLISWDGFKVLFGGDATSEVWDDIVNWIGRDRDAARLFSEINVFKSSHHGRSSSYCGTPLLKFMNPQTIIANHTVPNTESAYDDYYNFLKTKGKASNLYSVGRDTVIVDVTEGVQTYKTIYKAATINAIAN